MLDEEGGENRPDRVQAAEERRRDAVEAHGRDGACRTLPLLIARLIEERAAEAGQRTCDDEREDRVALFLHAAVFRGIFVEARGL